MDPDQQSSQKPDRTRSITTLSRFHLLTILLALITPVFYLISPLSLPLMLVCYVALLLSAPYFPSWRLFLPVICRGPGHDNAVSLTFDDGPDPVTTRPLLELLKQHQIKATFFVVGEKLQQYPELGRSILEAGHELGNHSQHHDPFLMLRNSKTLYREIADCRSQLAQLGINSVAFRPPVGITNPKLFRILASLGMYCVAFNRRPRDFGNRRIHGLDRKVLKSLKPGDIVLLHDKKPDSRFSLSDWLHAVESILHGAEARGFNVVPLSKLIGRTVMEKEISNQSQPPEPAAAIFNYLAHGYRKEGLGYPGTMPDLCPFLSTEPKQKLARVLELGPGDGAMCLKTARQVEQLTVLDFSQAMLNRIREQAAVEKVHNIGFSCQEVSNFRLKENFDLVYSFSCLEYAGDPAAVFRAVYDHLKPCGRFYCAVPTRSVSGCQRKLKTALNLGLPVRLFSRNILQTLAKKTGFKDLQFYQTNTSTSCFIEFSALKR